jgi:hypothetical protein
MTSSFNLFVSVNNDTAVQSIAEIGKDSKRSLIHHAGPIMPNGFESGKHDICLQTSQAPLFGFNQVTQDFPFVTLACINRSKLLFLEYSSHSSPPQ